MSEDALIAFRTAALLKEAARTVVVIVAFVTVFALAFQIIVAQLAHI